MRPSALSRSNRHVRQDRILVWVVLMIVAIVVGAGGGVWATRYLFLSGYWGGGASVAGGDGGEAGTGSEGDAEQWYTCGMHPNVLQQGPGECPICHMKLTPLKKEAGGAGKAAEGGPKERKVLYWRAPMDPSYISDSPGKSPMGMDLVPVYAQKGESADGHTIRVDPVTIQNMGIRTTAVRRGPLVRTIRTVGRVDYDEQTVNFINTKFDGWIEQLLVDETGVLVEKGQPLFAVYSPKLYSAQVEYLVGLRGVEQMAKSTLLEMREESERTLEASRIQLKYFDVSDEQIERLRRTKQIQKTLTIHSPARGIVTEKMALEGMYVKPGMRLYTIADLARVWVYVDIYEYQLPWVRVGQQATMTLPYIPGKEFTGQVVYVYPYLEEQTRVIKVRLEFENPTLELKPGMYTNVTLAADLKREALLIPREAYIDSGTRQLVFVARGKGKFEPRDIHIGVETESGLTEVLYGLDEGDVVVTSGQFLLDAESKLREAVAKMMEAQRAPADGSVAVGTAGHAHEHAEAISQPVETEASEAPSAIPPDAEYACPMETHPDESDPPNQGPYFATEPGRCPRCGMTLQPLEELEWVQARIAAGESHVAYTCPDHPHVFSEQSGECPRCGRELEPFKVMYICPDPEHGGVISTRAGTCPHDGQKLTPYRGIWLSPEMADENAPPKPEVAEAAGYRCPVHPLVHSDGPGKCVICARELESAREVAVAERPERSPIPPGAEYVCPMEECWHFAAEQGQCPQCGMKLKRIEEVEWAKQAVAEARAAAEVPQYVCPMHPEQVSANQRGSCPVCGMRLVAADAVPKPTTAPAAIAVQMDYLMEHYLEIQKRFASDRTSEVALHALGLVAATDELSKHLDDPGADLPREFKDAVGRLRRAALKTSGKNLDADRVTFVELSASMRTLVEHVRPDQKRYPDIYIFHCPMSKGDWLQTSEELANPYYGFKMLKCGELQAKR